MGPQLAHPARRTSTFSWGIALAPVVSILDSAVSSLLLVLLLLVFVRLFWVPAMCSSLESTYADFDSADEMRAEDRDGCATDSILRLLVGRLLAAFVSPQSTSR